jgi:DNA-binding transcriptional regulator GbsR (MarR family)
MADTKRVCTVPRDELTPDEKKLAVLSALQKNGDGLTTSDVRDATGMSNDDVRNAIVPLQDRGQLKVAKIEQDGTKHAKTPRTYFRTAQGRKAMMCWDYGDPSDLTEGTVAQTVEQLKQRISKVERDAERQAATIDTIQRSLDVRYWRSVGLLRTVQHLTDDSFDVRRQIQQLVEREID